MDILERLNKDMAAIFSQSVKGLCPVCKTVQDLCKIGDDHYVQVHDWPGNQKTCHGSRRYVSERKED